MEIEIREMDMSEFDIVMDLHLEGLEREFTYLNKIIPGKSVNHDERPQLKKVIYNMLHSGECNIFIAKDTENYLGYCLVTKKVYPVETPNICGCINGIYVREHLRRDGVGTKMFKAAEDWLKKENVPYLELYHIINDEGAANFWKKMGFVNVQLMCAKKL